MSTFDEARKKEEERIAADRKRYMADRKRAFDRARLLLPVVKRTLRGYSFNVEVKEDKVSIDYGDGGRHSFSITPLPNGKYNYISWSTYGRSGSDAELEDALGSLGEWVAGNKMHVTYIPPFIFYIAITTISIGILYFVL